MRVALISDVHANLVALDAVLAHADGLGIDETWHLGDLVGYGPEPAGVIARFVEVGAKNVLGNHDAATAGMLGTREFNPLAAAAVAWTKANVGEEELAYLRKLGQVEVEGDFTRVHGTLAEPLWEYLATTEAALKHFELQETPYSVVGHTHLPLVVRHLGDRRLGPITPEDGETVELDENPAVVNPGGVGQPRDGDPRASYALLDTGQRTVTFHRVAYDVATTQARMRELGLPEPLAARLSRGR